MNEKETIKILATIAASYPSVDRLNENAIQGMAKIWAKMFRDDDAKLVGLAVGEHIATNKFPPSVSEIRERLMQMQRPDILSPEDAWTAVQELMFVEGEFGRGNNIKLLPPLARRALGQIGWSSLYDRNKHTDARAKFMDAYMPLYKRERERAMLPPSLAAEGEQVRRLAGADVYNGLNELAQLRQSKNETYRRFFPGMYGEEEDALEDGGDRPALNETN